MPNRSAALSEVFRGLADPTRRAVVERLGHGPQPVSALARPFKMALPSFAQHLQVLEDCGLVTSRKRGRVRTYRLVPRRLDLAADWLGAQRAHWHRRLDQLDATLVSLKESR